MRIGGGVGGGRREFGRYFRVSRAPTVQLSLKVHHVP